MAGRSLVFYLTILSLSGSGLVVGKLLISGLSRSYPAFFWYFVFRIYLLFISLQLDVRSDAYFYHFVFMEPIVWAFYILVVGELWGLILNKYQGLKWMGRIAMVLAVAIAGGVSLFLLTSKLTPASSQRTKLLFQVLGSDRGITLALLLFLIVMLLFLSRYPVHLPRNVLVHATVFTLFFLSSTLSTLVKSLFGVRFYDAFDTALIGFSAICVFAWLFLLTRRGEEVTATIPSFTPEQEERILYTLDTLNAHVLKVGTK
jgi:hypothetical protein